MSNILHTKIMNRIVYIMLALSPVFAAEARAQDTATPTPAAAVTAAATPAASVSCFVSPAKLADAEVQSFIGAPLELLTAFPAGGFPMTSRVRALAGSSQDTLKPIVGLVSSASPAQVASIGAGLATVARVCAKVNPEYAATIQTLVAELDDDGLNVAFAAASSDIQTAALGAGGGGGGAGGAAGIGGGGVAGGGTAGVLGDESTATTSGTFSADASSPYFSSNDGGGAAAVPGSAN